jgi:hypothetical protein
MKSLLQYMGCFASVSKIGAKWAAVRINSETRGLSLGSLGSLVLLVLRFSLVLLVLRRRADFAVDPKKPFQTFPKCLVTGEEGLVKVRCWSDQGTSVRGDYGRIVLVVDKLSRQKRPPLALPKYRFASNWFLQSPQNSPT